MGVKDWWRARFLQVKDTPRHCWVSRSPRTETPGLRSRRRRSDAHSFIRSVDCDVLTVGEAFENAGLLQISPELLSLGLGHLCTTEEEELPEMMLV